MLLNKVYLKQLNDVLNVLWEARQKRHYLNLEGSA